MITIELQVKFRDLTTEQEEAFRLYLRKSVLPWLFTQADSFGHDQKIGAVHDKLGVTGDIKLEIPNGQDA
jgi:hypothetical protein